MDLRGLVLPLVPSTDIGACRIDVELAAAGDDGAVAAMMTLLMNLRASEIINRVARDVDDDGRVLWIPAAKTAAGKRTLEVPAVLVPFLVELAGHKEPDERIFAGHWRDWVRKQVKRICGLAGVPLVNAHSMRGSHASLATERGVTGHVVAAALGHESVTTTYRSYATPASISSGKQRRLIDVLDLGTTLPVDSNRSPIVPPAFPVPGLPVENN